MNTFLSRYKAHLCEFFFTFIGVWLDIVGIVVAVAVVVLPCVAATYFSSNWWLCLYIGYTAIYAVYLVAYQLNEGPCKHHWHNPATLICCDTYEEWEEFECAKCGKLSRFQKQKR